LALQQSQTPGLSDIMYQVTTSYQWCIYTPAAVQSQSLGLRSISFSPAEDKTISVLEAKQKQSKNKNILNSLAAVILEHIRNAAGNSEKAGHPCSSWRELIQFEIFSELEATCYSQPNCFFSKMSNVSSVL